MTNDRMARKLNEQKPISTRLAGRPKTRCENDVKQDLRYSNIFAPSVPVFIFVQTPNRGLG
jgi:hypothetical protein